MNQTPIPIRLEDWELFGGGYTAESYYSKNDPGLMLKLYAPFMKPESPLTELMVSENVESLGFPVASPISFVQYKDRYGAIFERIRNKKSFSRILADEPERLDEIVDKWVSLSDKLHSTPCNTEVFPDAGPRFHDIVSHNTLLTEPDKQKVHAFLDSIPAATTCLHLDWHIGNVLESDGKLYIIDLADFSYGNPLFDFGNLYLLSHLPMPDEIEKNYHISQDFLRRFWDKSLVKFFPDLTYEEAEKKTAPFGALSTLFYNNMIGLRPHMEDAVNDWLLKPLSY